MTIDVRHSRVMKRQYLNVLYSPTAAYKGHTEGLCGFMDNNATNDFMGPDGTLYNGAVQFAESCKQLLKRVHFTRGVNFVKKGGFVYSSHHLSVCLSVCLSQ